MARNSPTSPEKLSTSNPPTYGRPTSSPPRSSPTNSATRPSTHPVTRPPTHPIARPGHLQVNSTHCNLIEPFGSPVDMMSPGNSSAIVSPQGWSSRRTTSLRQTLDSLLRATKKRLGVRPRRSASHNTSVTCSTVNSDGELFVLPHHFHVLLEFAIHTYPEPCCCYDG